MSNQSINDRIGLLIESLKATENSFSKLMGVSSSAMFNIVNPKGRRSYPSGVVLEKILAFRSDNGRVSAEWLMRGEGVIFQLIGDENAEKGEVGLKNLAARVFKLEEEMKICLTKK